MPRVVPPTPDALDEAVRRLAAGEVVAFPTETVYGLGADTFNPRAVGLVFALKGRPIDNPLIAHVLDAAGARRVARVFSARCEALAQRFWPGPLTLVLPRHIDVPPRATAGLDTIAVRSPAHPIARQLLERFGSPISAPSANRSGRVSPTTAQHVQDDFSRIRDLLIIDGGPCELGIESTVLDMTSSVPHVLRPGSVTIESLRQTLGEVQMKPLSPGQSISPGTAPRHYAPRTPAELVRPEHLRERLLELERSGTTAVVLRLGLRPDESTDEEHEALILNPQSSIPDPQAFSLKLHALAMPSDPEGYAAMLYRALRRADAMACSRIIIEQPPEDDAGLWAAVHDRLRRATRKMGNGE